MTAGTVIRRILCVLLVTVLLVCAFLYGVMFLLCKGPSETARNLFVLSVRESSALGFLANLYLSDAQIAEILRCDAFSPVGMQQISFICKRQHIAGIRGVKLKLSCFFEIGNHRKSPVSG